MGKLNSPLLSLGARGSLGGAITFQKKGQDTIVREKPIPTDPYTLRQAYHRWLYRDWAYIWTIQTEATRREYAAEGSRHHLTGFQQWMKEHLAVLPNIIAWWRLDEVSGATALDSSGYGSNGTIIGASPTTGAIAGGYYFDGINDLIDCGSPAILPFGHDLFALACFIQTTILARGGIVSRFAGILENWFLELRADGTPRILIFNTLAAVYAQVIGPTSVADGLIHHLHANWEPAVKLELFVDGLSVGTDVAFVGALPTDYPDLHIGRHADNWYAGIVDNVILFDALQTQPEIALWSERRYP